MHTTLKAFLHGQHEDAADQVAQRALKAHKKLSGPSGFMANAYERGDGEAYTMVSRAHLGVSAAFYVVNAAKRYPFADQVISEMPHLAILGDVGDVASAAEAIVVEAEQVIEQYAERCAPTYSLSGIGSVRILRGAHALAAMQGLVPANQA